MKARKRVNKFFDREFWYYRITEKELIAEAAMFPDIAGFLDPYTASQLNETLDAYPDGKSIGQAIIDRWIDSFRANPPYEINGDNPFNRPLHPAIEDLFANLNAKAQDKLTVADACATIIEQSGWGAMEEVAMRRATVEDFETVI